MGDPLFTPIIVTLHDIICDQSGHVLLDIPINKKLLSLVVRYKSDFDHAVTSNKRSNIIRHILTGLQPDGSNLCRFLRTSQAHKAQYSILSYVDVRAAICQCFQRPLEDLCDAACVIQPLRPAGIAALSILPPRGIPPIQNGCFLVSTLQCLAALPPFVDAILRISNSQSTQTPLFNDMADILRYIHSWQQVENNGLTGSLLSLATKFPSLCDGNQQDPHEFFVLLLSRLQSESATSVPMELFQFFLSDRVICRMCQHRTNTDQISVFLPLDISHAATVSVVQGFNAFTSPEPLSASNNWMCPLCYGCNGTKQTRITSPPPVLCLLLKRFYFTPLLQPQKIAKVIHLEQSFLLDSTQYNLASFLCHHGTSADSGHYTAMVSKSISGSNGLKWYHANDSIVTSLDKPNFSPTTAYLVFYLRSSPPCPMLYQPLQSPVVRNAQDAIIGSTKEKTSLNTPKKRNKTGMNVVEKRRKANPLPRRLLARPTAIPAQDMSTFHITDDELKTRLQQPDCFGDLMVNPFRAVLLFYLNSGYFRFDQYKEYSSTWDNTPVDVDAQEKEILDTMPTTEEATRIAQSFFRSHSYAEATLPACGVCGYRVFEREANPAIKFTRLYLRSEKAQVLTYSEEQTKDLNDVIRSPSSRVRIPVDDSWESRSIELWRARSVYVQKQPSSPDAFWHLHPELVDVDTSGFEFTMVCPVCDGKLLQRQIPSLSVAAGVDFGYYKRIGLELPNLEEVMILSRSRLYHAVVKGMSNTYGQRNYDTESTTRCHAILFPHDAPDVASYMFNPDIFETNGLLDVDNLKNQMLLYFLDPDGNPDRLARDIFGTNSFLGRPWVIAQWLITLKWLHPSYLDLDLGPMHALQERLRCTMDKVHEHLRSNAMTITDEDALAFEKALGSDVAGVCRNETSAHQAEGTPTAASNDGLNVVHGPRLTYSFVTNTDEAYLCGDAEDVRVQALRRFVNTEKDKTSPELSDAMRDQEDRFDFQPEKVEAFLRRFPPDLGNTSVRQPNPTSDFEKDDVGVSTSFPHVFMLGKAYGRQFGRLSPKHRNHLFNQFTQVPSLDRRLLAFCVDVIRRMKVIDGVRYYLKQNRRAMNAIQDLLNDKNEKARIKLALESPNSKDSRALIGTYLRHMRMAGKDVSFGGMEGSKLRHRIEGLIHRFSVPTCFLTLSPNNLDNPRSIRMAFHTTSNTTFPATFESGCKYGENGQSFMQHLRTNASLVSEGHIRLPKHVRAQLSMSNPVAFVQENKTLLSDIMTILLGLTMESEGFHAQTEAYTSRKTDYFMSRPKGIFGHAMYAIGVTEDHSKGTIHFHLILSAGLPPYVLQRFASIETLCAAITKVLDVAYVSQVSADFHVANIVRKVVQDSEIYWGIPRPVIESIRSAEPLLLRTEPSQELSDQRLFLRAIDHQAASQQQHEHKQTCHKGIQGQTGCRLSMGQTTIPLTVPVKLRPDLSPQRGVTDCSLVYDISDPSETLDSDDDGLPDGHEFVLDKSNCATIHSRSTGVYQSIPYAVIPFESFKKDNVNYSTANLLSPAVDPTVIVWETARPPIKRHLLLPLQGMEATTRQWFVDGLKHTLYQQDGFTDHQSLFWRWLENDATDDQVSDIQRTVQERLQGANGLIACFNPLLSFCSGSHNNTSLLGSIGQARSACFYLIPYGDKNKFPLHQPLSIYDHALNYVEKYPSVASDSGTPQRSALHFLMRSLNRMHLCIELSEHQAAAFLLNLPSLIESEKTVYGSPGALIALRANQAFAKGGSWGASKMSPQTGTASSTGKDSLAASLEASMADLGYIRKLVLDPPTKQMPYAPSRTILVPMCAFYHYRGAELRHLNYYEYLACIELRNGKPKYPEQCKRQLHFHLHPDFEGRSDCYHVIRQKQATPLLTGKPPRHPGDKPRNVRSKEYLAWITKANTYARYYLTLFRPEDNTTHFTYEWNDLETWINQLTCSKNMIDTFRLMCMDNHMKGFRTSSMVRRMASDYRARSRDLWTDQERSQYAHEKWLQNQRRIFYKPSDAFEEPILPIKPSTLTRMKRMLKHDAAQVAQLEQILGITHEEDRGPLGHRHPATGTVEKVTTSFISRMRPYQLQAKLDGIRTYTGPESRRRSTSGNNSYRSLNRAKSEIHQIRRSLYNGHNTQQMTLFDMYSNFFLGQSESKPPQIVLLHGGPGMGKSKLRDAIIEAAEACGRFVLKTAFNAINASEMGGDTTASVVSLQPAIHQNDMGRFATTYINALRQKGLNHDSLLVIEEVSTQAPFHLARIHRLCQVALDTIDRNKEESSLDSFFHRLEELRHLDGDALQDAAFPLPEIVSPFGGLLVLMVGDLTQLGPVKAGETLTQAVMQINGDGHVISKMSKMKKKSLNKKTVIPPVHREDRKYMATHPFAIGARLLTSSRWYELTEQHRSKDPRHTARIFHTYHGNKINLPFVKDGGYKILSQGDVQDVHDMSWVHASILTATNRERCSLTHVRSVYFAKRYNTVVIRWVNNYLDHTWEQKPSGTDLVAALDDPCFHEYFVVGADGFFTDNYNKPLRLVNGLPMRFHSIKFDAVNERYLKNFCKKARAGDVITMPAKPLTVNVEVFLPASAPRHVIAALKKYGIKDDRPHACSEDDRIIIPVSPFACKPDSNKTTVYGGAHYPPSKIRLSRFFPLEPAFAITVHKSEGRTVRRAIIALSDSTFNFKYEQFHVAFSRVEEADHIRLLLTGRTEPDQWYSLTYLERLKPDPSIQYFFDGFRSADSVGITDPNFDWTNNVWSQERANFAFRRVGQQADQ